MCESAIHSILHRTQMCEQGVCMLPPAAVAHVYNIALLLQELLVAEKDALKMQLSISESSLQQHQQQLSELTQKHTAIQAELGDSLEYQQQIEAQLNELEMEAQAAKASYEAEQSQYQKLRAEVDQTQAELSRVDNELTHTKTALTQTSGLNTELQVQ